MACGEKTLDLNNCGNHLMATDKRIAAQAGRKALVLIKFGHLLANLINCDAKMV